MIINFFMSPLMALLPLFVNKIHGGTEINYALVVGMLQAAIVVGGLFMSFFKGFKKPVLFFIFSVLFQQTCQIIITFIPTNFNGRFWIIGSILFCLALPFSVIDVTFITALQLLIPKEKLGRVIATIMAISPAIRPLGQFLSGIIAEFIGIKTVLIASSVLGAISLILIYLCTSMKRLDHVIQRVMTKENEKEKIEPKEEIITEDEEFDKKISSEISINTASASYRSVEKSINIQK